MPQKRGRRTTNAAVQQAADNIFGGIIGEDSVWESAVDTVIDKTESVISVAKTKLQQPLETVERVAEKAIPASLAACASLQYTGGIGSFANYLQPINLRTKYFRLDGDRSAYIGKPLNENRQLSTLSGFCQCDNVKLEVSGATLEEQQLIKQYLEAGCFIE